MRDELEKKAKHEKLSNIIFLGYQTRQQLIAEIRKAMFVVLPSEWFENNPFAILEAFASGKPVLASHIGGIPELVKDLETGFTFTPGAADELREKIQYFLTHPQFLAELGENARKFVEHSYCPEKYFHHLMHIYAFAIERRNKNGSRNNHHL